MKITRILVALSFLFAVSNVNAGEMTVTGNMEATYITGSGTDNTTGNPLGMDKELKFAGSTELDSGITVSVMQDTSDALAFGNSQIAFGNIAVPALGAITLYVGSDSDPIDAIDDVTPSAYEEANGSGSGTYADIGGAAGQMGLGLKATLPMVGALNYKHYPKIDSTKNADNANSGDASGSVGDAFSVSLKTNLADLAPALDGASLTTGYGEREVSTLSGTEVASNATMALNYAYGPLKLGVQRKYNNLGSTTALGHDVRHNDVVYGLAYAVNDSLSLSYNRYQGRKTNHGSATGNEKQETDAFNLGYTVGGMVIGLQHASTDNAGYVLAAEDDSTTLGLSVAF
jgi:hypothetical protein